MRWTKYFGVGTRRVAPDSRAQWVLAGTCAAVIAACVWMGRSLLGSPPPEDTLARAHRFLDRPLRLGRALDVSWSFAVRDGGGMAGRADDLLAAPLPPFLCSARWPGARADEARALDRAIRQARQAATAESRNGLANTVEALEDWVAGASAVAEPFALYAVARARGAGGDWSGAARALGSVPLVQRGGGPLPVVSRSDAAQGFQSRGARRAEAVLAFHVRYLAGRAAHGRGRPEDAIGHFRRALNAVRYVLGSSRGVGPGGHFRRTDMRPGALSCSGVAQPGLTSLDAYAGLVAAYLAAPGFRDPEGLADEVARNRLEMDPGDPLAPLVRYAQQAAAADRRPGQGPIPENVLWAASNLQRVYHYNRLRPDPRLAASRAVLAWRVLDEPEWTRALELDAATQCEMLAGVAAGLRQDGATASGSASSAAVGDSAWAAVAVHTFARLEAQCPGTEREPVAEAVRERWLDRSGGFIHGGLVVRYEARRRVLEAGGRSAGLSGESATEPGDILAEARSHARTFCRGAVPPEMSAGIEPDAACEFVVAWRQAVFHDVADQLVQQVRSGGVPAARDAADYVRTVEAAVAHAGLRPSAVYGVEDVAPLLRSQGGVRAWSRRLRHTARNRPATAVASMALLGATVAGLAVLAFVSWWRFLLLTRTDFYADEAAERGGRHSAEARRHRHDEKMDHRHGAEPDRDVGRDRRRSEEPDRRRDEEPDRRHEEPDRRDEESGP